MKAQVLAPLGGWGKPLTLAGGGLFFWLPDPVTQGGEAPRFAR